MQVRDKFLVGRGQDDFCHPLDSFGGHITVVDGSSFKKGKRPFIGVNYTSSSNSFAIRTEDYLLFSSPVGETATTQIITFARYSLDFRILISFADRS